jgi:hypothetical protein
LAAYFNNNIGNIYTKSGKRGREAEMCMIELQRQEKQEEHGKK